MSLFVLLVLTAIISTIVCEDDSTNCAPWLGIQQKLKEQNVRVNCTQNITCTGLSCIFKEYGQEIHSSIHVVPCENPPSLEFGIDAPKLNIIGWKRKFYHGEIFSLTDSFGGELKLQNVNDTFVLGLTLQYHMDKNHTPPILHFLPTVIPHIQYPLFQNIVVPIPSCAQHGSSFKPDIITSISVTTLPSTKIPLLGSKGSMLVNSNCTIGNISCPENELCQQINTSTSAGFCVCIPDYVRNKDGKCVYSPTPSYTTEVPGNHTEPNHPNTSNTSLLLTAILVPITVIFFLVGLVYATVRFRICQKMRRRLRVQVYEHVLLGQDDEMDDESLNPVV